MNTIPRPAAAVAADTMQDSSCILLFTKAPEKGKVKSRLAAEIGEENALALHKSFVLDFIGMLKKGGHPFRVFYYPPDAGEETADWLGKGPPYRAQKGNDLGERMADAFAQTFSEGFERVLIVGSDIPDLTNALLDEAFSSLEDRDTVIGPASDGGYYLIGFGRGGFLPEVFRNIPWGTETVFRDTVAILSGAGSRVHVLTEWEDVDTLDGLRALFMRNIHTGFMGSGTMSYIVRNRHALFRGACLHDPEKRAKNGTIRL